MKLKQKFAITFVAAILIFVGVNYYLQYFVAVPSYEDMDRAVSVDDIKRCELALRFLSINMNRLVQDYAIWDDTYQYLKGANNDFVKTNLDGSTFENNDVDFIMIYDNNKELVWENGINPHGDKNLHPTSEQMIKSLVRLYSNILSDKGTSKKQYYSGLVRVDGFILALAACSIFPSNQKGECLGTFIMAKVMDSEELKELCALVMLNFTISPMSDKESFYLAADFSQDNIYSVKSVSDQLLEVLSVYPDINGDPVFKIKTFVSRELFLKSKNLAQTSFFIILASGLLLIILIGLIVQSIVINPLSKITTYAKKIRIDKDYSLELEMRKTDEIGDLNREFNLMLRQVKSHSDGLEGLVREKTEEVHQSRTEMIYRLALAAEKKDDETGKHLSRIYGYIKLLAKNYGLTDSHSEILALAGILHDVGKIGIADAILRKPGKLTDEEYKIVKTHTTIGGNILANGTSKLITTAYETALYHHEHYDGNGYPEGIKGKDIPLSARLTAIVDVFDALISKRVYKDAWDLKQIIRFFNEQKGKMFDPQIVNCFLLDIESFVKIRNDNADN